MRIIVKLKKKKKIEPKNDDGAEVQQIMCVCEHICEVVLFNALGSGWIRGWGGNRRMAVIWVRIRAHLSPIAHLASSLCPYLF